MSPKSGTTGQFITLLCLFFILIHVSHAAVDKSKDDIAIGMSTTLSGPAKALGMSMKAGVEAYFQHINESGGIRGRKLKLIVLDDGYEPARSAPNMRELIDKHKVLAVIGNVGDPTAVVSVPIANEKKTLFFGAFSGADFLRKSPPDRYVINYRASYNQETTAMIKGLLSAGVQPSEIAFFTQNDGLGDAGYNGAIEALKQYGYKNAEKLPHGRYTRNTTNVERGLATIIDSDKIPKAIIIVGTYSPVAKFIKLAKREFPKTLFLNVSFVGSEPLVKALGNNTSNVIITQVVPHIHDDLLAVREFESDLLSYNKNITPDFASLEGYISAKIFVEGLKSVRGGMTRESIVDALESLKDVDIGIGIKISYSMDQHQASQKIWPTKVVQDEFVPLEWEKLWQQ